MADRFLPSGTVAFVFTDVEGSTALLRDLGDRWAPLLATSHALLREAVEAAGGVVVDNEGDGAFLAFPDVRTAVTATVAAQVALLAHPWPADAPVRVRAGIHAGQAEPVDGRYVALAVHEAARVGAVAHGGQVVLSEQAVLLLEGALPDGAVLSDRGRFGLRDFPLPVRLYDVTAPGLPAVERGLRAVPADGGNLPAPAGPLHGRDDELAALADLPRLTTLVGPPGVGKTATALAAARAWSAADGVWLVPLEPLPAVRSVASAILATLGLPVVATDDAVAAQLSGRQLLLLLDGADDRLPEVAEFAAAMSRKAPDVRVLVTARTPLGVEGERVVRVHPLPVPAEDTAPGDVLAAPSVRVLLGADQRWADPRHAEALAGLARRADGLPLALELVGARLAALSPADLLGRVDAQLARAGRTGALRDALESTWSALADPARQLWARLSVFAGPVDLDAVEQVCADDEVLPEDEVVDALTALVAGSVVLLEPRDDGVAYRLLRSVRQYGAEQLEGAGQTDALRDRHAEWVVAAVERWLRRADLEPPPGPLQELASTQDDVLVGLGHLGPRDPERVVALLLPLRRHLRESLDLADLLAVAERLPEAPGTDAVVLLLRAQLSWERSPGAETVPLFVAAADAAGPAAPPIRVDVLAQLVLAREQFGLDPDPAREADLERAAAQSGDPVLRVRATALRAHGASPADVELLDAAVDLARTQAPGLLCWATGRRLQLWSGQRPRTAEEDIDQVLLALPLIGASESTAGLLMASFALLTLGRPEQAGRLADRAAAASARRRNVVMAFHAAVLSASAAGALGDPDAPRLLGGIEANPVGRLGVGNAAMVEFARGWVLAAGDRDGAVRWAKNAPSAVPIVGAELDALAAAVQDPLWDPRQGLLGHLRVDAA